MTLDLGAQSPATFVLIGVAALALLATGGVLARRRPAAAPERIPADGKAKMMSLMDAAKAAYDVAKHERMVIAGVAERAGSDPIAWFAQSIAGVLAVYRAASSKDYEKLAGAAGADLNSLYIRKQDFQTYVRWARSMQ